MTALERSWFEEAQQSMHGWDFSHLAGRWQTADLPWDYAALVREHLSADDRWLDIDTGGGELMGRFNHQPALTAVTEGWQPNIELLKQTVVKKGITLYPDAAEQLTAVPNSTFDIVTNSHGAMPVKRIAEVLKPGGRFVTQQVGATNNYALSRFFDEHYEPAYPDNQLLTVMAQMQAAGFEILRAEQAYAALSFTDVGAIVYYATVIPWEFPNFDVARMLPKLHQLQSLLAINGRVTTFEDRFMIIARKLARRD
ncbi:MAG: class I SAM-dependent methyltransferase [Lactiplantibacillus plantarum]|nr:class I SAM-dependent methyltransferase [Lactiplantibacillus plantarum]